MNLGEWKDVVTIVVLVAGSIGAVWKWGFSEYLRRRNEAPTMDGDFRTRVEPINEETAAVEFCATWRNKGSVPIFVDTKLSTIRIFDAEAQHELETIFSQEDEDPLKEVKPLSDYSFYFLEPATDSEIQTVVRLPSGRTFVAQFMLVVPVPHNGRRKFAAYMRRFFSVEEQVGNLAWVRTHLFSTKAAPHAE